MPYGFFANTPAKPHPLQCNYVIMDSWSYVRLWPLSYLARECSIELERTPRSPALPCSRILKHRLSRSEAPEHRRQANENTITGQRGRHRGPKIRSARQSERPLAYPCVLRGCP